MQSTRIWPVVMRDVACSMCRCVYLLVTAVSHTETAESIKVPFQVVTQVGPRNRALVGGPTPPKGRGICGGEGISQPTLYCIGNIRQVIDISTLFGRWQRQCCLLLPVVKARSGTV